MRPPSETADYIWMRQWQERAARLDAIDLAAPAAGERSWAVATLRKEEEFLERRFLRSGQPLDEGYGAYYLKLGVFAAGAARATRREADEDRAFAHSLIFLS